MLPALWRPCLPRSSWRWQCRPPTKQSSPAPRAIYGWCGKNPTLLRTSPMRATAPMGAAIAGGSQNHQGALAARRVSGEIQNHHGGPSASSSVRTSSSSAWVHAGADPMTLTPTTTHRRRDSGAGRFPTAGRSPSSYLFRWCDLPPGSGWGHVLELAARQAPLGRRYCARHVHPQARPASDEFRLQRGSCAQAWRRTLNRVG